MSLWRKLLRSPACVRAATGQHLRATYDTQSGDAELLLDGSKVAARNRLLPVEGSYNRIYVGAVEHISTFCSIANEFIGDIDELDVWAKLGWHGRGVPQLARSILFGSDGVATSETSRKGAAQ